MDSEDRVRQLAELLQQTGSAHHSCQTKVLDQDQDAHWPEWQSECLIGHGLHLLLWDRLAAELFVDILRKCRAEFRDSGSTLPWEQFAARRIVERPVLEMVLGSGF